MKTPGFLDPGVAIPTADGNFFNLTIFKWHTILAVHMHTYILLFSFLLFLYRKRNVSKIYCNTAGGGRHCEWKKLHLYDNKTVILVLHSGVSISYKKWNRVISC